MACLLVEASCYSREQAISILAAAGERTIVAIREPALSRYTAACIESHFVKQLQKPHAENSTASSVQLLTGGT